MTHFLEKVRPGWDEWALGIAYAVGPGPTGRADCTRRKVGAIIVEPHRHDIVGVGYNGGPRGGPSCLKGECPRGRHYRIECVCGACHDTECAGPGVCESRHWCDGEIPGCACGEVWPCRWAVEPGSSYDTGPGSCVAIHAEVNALLNVSDRRRLDGATIYVTAAPCEGCQKILGNTDISRIVWPGGEILKGPGPA